MRNIGDHRPRHDRARCLALSSQGIPEAKGKLVRVGRRLDVDDSWREFEERQYRKYLHYTRFNFAFGIFVIALIPVVFVAVILRLAVG